MQEVSIMQKSLAAYEALTDEELQLRCSEGDGQAEEILAERYSIVVRSCVRPFFLAGGDSEDLTQEGMLGLLSAIRTYAADRGTSFRTYAELCVRRRVLSAIRTASRQKHTPLNEGISLEAVEEGESEAARAYPIADFRRLPEEQVLAKESVSDFINTYAQCLSPLEQRILPLFLDGLSYQSISEQTGKNPKSVDNAVQRIRRKLARQITSGDFSES